MSIVQWSQTNISFGGANQNAGAFNFRLPIEPFLAPFTNPAPSFGSQGFGSQNFGSQNFGSQSFGSQNFGGQNFFPQSFLPQNNGGALLGAGLVFQPFNPGASSPWSQPKIGDDLFRNEMQRLPLDRISSMLEDRFGSRLNVRELVSGFNLGSSDASRLVQNLGKNGSIPLSDFMDHLARFSNQSTGRMTRSDLEEALLNGVNNLNVERFQAPSGRGIDLSGFLEMARRAGSMLPDDLLKQVFERAAAIGRRGSDSLLDPREMQRAFGVSPDRNGDIDVRALAQGVDRAAMAHRQASNCWGSSPGWRTPGVRC